MYIDVVPNRTSPPAILLRESYRDGNKVRKRTLLNLSSWPRDLVEGFRALLKGGSVIPAGQDALRIIRSLPHGHVAPCWAPCGVSVSTACSDPTATGAAISPSR